MKKVTGICEERTMGYVPSEALIEWEYEAAKRVAEQIDSIENIDIYGVLAETLTPERVAKFSMLELVKIKESCSFKESRGVLIKISSEIILRLFRQENKNKIRYYLSLETLEDLGECLQVLVLQERFEAVCHIRDEINSRNINK